MGTAISWTECNQVAGLTYTTCTTSLNMGLFGQLSYENGCYDTSHHKDTHCLVLEEIKIRTIFEELNQKLLHSRTCIVSIENAKYVACFSRPHPTFCCLYVPQNQNVAAKAMQGLGRDIGGTQGWLTTAQECRKLRSQGHEAIWRSSIWQGCQFPTNYYVPFPRQYI